jgi:pyruvate/2-oxoglutarate dehydrogenase complex dihydrolipoamide dehydrogenase (E3) component
MIRAREQLDAIVIGTGEGGRSLALSFARSGRRTAIIDRGEDGGAARPSPAETPERLEVVFGEARFCAPREIEVATARAGTRRMSAATIVIDTGLRQDIPPIEGLKSVKHLDNRSVVELENPPPNLLIIGGGAPSLEFGQTFRRLGSEVTIVTGAQCLLEDEDEDVNEAVAQILADEGIRILHESAALRARGGNGAISVDMRSRGVGSTSIEASHLLIAGDRVPDTDRLNLAATGVATDTRGFIRTNDRLETSATGIYAIGVVKGGATWMDVSYDDSRVLEENLLKGGDASIAERLVPRMVHIDPEFGRVGLTETRARERGIRYRLAKTPLSRTGRAVTSPEPCGFMKALVDPDTCEILGCAVLGERGGEIMSVLEVAMIGTLPYTALRDAIFAKTHAASINLLFATFDE